MQRQTGRQRGTENAPMNSSTKKGHTTTRRSIFDFPESKEPQRIRRVKARRKMIQDYRNTIREIYHQTDYLVDWKDEDLSCFITPIEKTGNAAMMGKSCHSDNYSKASEFCKNEISDLDIEPSTNQNIEYSEKSTQLSDQGVATKNSYSEKEDNDLPQEIVFENTQTNDFSNEEETICQQAEEEVEEEVGEEVEEKEEEKEEGIEGSNQYIEESYQNNEEEIIEESDGNIQESNEENGNIEEEEEIGENENDTLNEEEAFEQQNDNDEEVFENETVEMTLLGVGDLPNESPQNIFVTIQHYSGDKPIGQQYKADDVFSDDPQSYTFQNVNENEIIELLVWQNNEGGEDPSLVSGIKLNVDSINWEETGSQFFDLVSADDLRAGSDSSRGNAGNVALVFNIFTKE